MNTHPSDIPVPGPARFDDELEAWVLTSYADVRAALREPRLTASGARGGGDLDRAGHLEFRAAAAAAAAGMLDGWPAGLEPAARDMARALPAERPVDLVSELAGPWSAEVAKRLLCPGSDMARMATLAGEVFAAAAEPGDEALQARAAQATLELARAFSGELAAFHVQAFVALSETLPCFLANAWLALLNDPASAAMLRAEPGLMAAAIEELLRHSGPARAQFRRATGEVALGGVTIAQGGRVALMLAAANRDPEQFPEPDRLDFGRGAARHLAFGDGPHACIGGALVRAAAAAATAGFIECFAGAHLQGPVEWRGGFAIRAPASLLVSR
ncbi:MAG: cytochrome P450 [Acidobacteria bacterium]|nr:cytochrome P450 [Acidobacteriota bacterium]